MGYYVRLLTKSNKVVPFSELKKFLEEKRPDVVLELGDGTDESWESLSLAHKDGQHISIMERNPVADGTLGEEELEEFIEMIEDCEPVSGAQWLLRCLPDIKTIYAFQIIFGGAERDDGWDALDMVKEHLWEELGGLLQADDEGFSNEQGAYIIWQFSQDVTGLLNMAVLDRSGKWVFFEMDVGNRKHRKAFLRGKVPRGAKVLKI
jgi:hypothetical protein